MDSQNVDVIDPKNALTGERMEDLASDDEEMEKGHSGTENVNDDKVITVNENDERDLEEEMISESVLIQEVTKSNDEAKDLGDQPRGLVIVDGDIDEEVNERAQPEEMQSPTEKPDDDDSKNEGYTTDEQGNLPESKDKTDFVETQKVETAGHEAKDELIETLPPGTNNLDVASVKEKINEAGNSENEGEQIGDSVHLFPEKLNETLVSKNEGKSDQQETEKEESVIFDSSENSKLELTAQLENNNDSTGIEQIEEKKKDPVIDGTEVHVMATNRSASSNSLNVDPGSSATATISEKAVAFKNFVTSSVAVSSFIRRLSGKKEGDHQGGKIDDGKGPNESPNADDGVKKLEEVTETESTAESETKDLPQKTERSTWNPLTFLMMSRDAESKAQVIERVEAEPLLPITMKGRIILYTRLGCQECKDTRLFLHQKRLGYVEVNIDVYPSRKSELEKLTGSSSVPKIFFNQVFIGGLSELKSLDESKQLDEKINYLIAEAPTIEAPLPPLSGEDDESNNGIVDENALFVRKMRESILVRDRFHRMRRYTSCFLGTDAVNFISEDQHLEREEAIEFGRELASQFFIMHVLEEHLFEDGNHLYRFLDQDPIVASQCQNIPRGILDVKPKPITEIASRLRFLQYAMLEAYASDDGRHLDYRSIHGSEEFARYLRTIEELQRVDIQDMTREEKLAFFINLYNMMTIHAILIWGHPTGALDRRRVFGDFKYVVGGCTYSLSAIQNGILRANQRPPYNLVRPFGLKDKRVKLVLSHVEPLIHFALVCGTRSSPALRCYSPGNIDKELTEAARNFVKTGGLIVDLNNKVVSVSKILKWFSADFGKNETEVVKHVANYLDPPESEAMLELLANNQLKVAYQPYDWGLNH